MTGDRDKLLALAERTKFRLRLWWFQRVNTRRTYRWMKRRRKARALAGER